MRPDEVDLSAGHPVTSPSPLTLVPEPRQLDEDAGLYPTAPVTGGQASFTWDFGGAGKVRQVSLSAAGADVTTQVQLELRLTDGRWLEVASAAGPVGEGRPTAFLLDVPAAPLPATAMRVRVLGSGTAQVHDVHALGTRS